LKGFLICIEGIDGSGEGTNARLLLKKLKKEGYKVGSVSFPDYTTPIGKEIKRFLQGKHDVIPEVRQCLFAANRWERKPDIEKWLNEGKIVIANRYTPSGLVYGLANGLDLEWMINLERGLPPADMVIVIDVSVDTHFQRITGRDIYEKDRFFLERVRTAYLDLARKFKWKVVDGERQVDEVAGKVWELTSRLIRTS
jgi:dTMP kinase